MHLLIINAVFIFSKAILSLSTFSTDLNLKLSLILFEWFILPSKLPHLLLLHFNLETGSYFSFFPQHPRVSPNCWVFRNISIYLHRNYTANSQVLKCNSYISKYSFLISTFMYLNNKCWVQVVLGVKVWQNLPALGVRVPRVPVRAGPWHCTTKYHVLVPIQFQWQHQDAFCISASLGMRTNYRIP